MSTPLPSLPPGSRVAIVGGGSAGVYAIREALKQGLQPTLFEESGSVGGVRPFRLSRDFGVERDFFIGGRRCGPLPVATVVPIALHSCSPMWPCRGASPSFERTFFQRARVVGGWWVMSLKLPTGSERSLRFLSCKLKSEPSRYGGLTTTGTASQPTAPRR